MCLAVPGKILAIQQSADLLTADVDFSGLKKRICLAFTPDAKVGDYVVVHVGFSISLLSEDQAKETLSLLEKI